jgi:hypothetical protein
MSPLTCFAIPTKSKLPRQPAAFLNSSADFLLFAQSLIAAGKEDFATHRIDLSFHMFLKFKMSIDVAADNFLVEIDSLFARRV